MEVIQVNNLSKVYKVKHLRKGILGGLRDLVTPQYELKEAVRGINFTVQEGEAVGYIGPNGSGKSTTIKMLTGVLTPTSGKVIVNGLEPSKNRKENAMKIGVVFGQRSQLWWDLAIRESFDIFHHIYRIPTTVFKRNRDMMMELLDIRAFEATPVRQLSLGQRMRAEVACAFFHDPAICYLDEPTIGLDVVVKEQIRKFLREINKEKKTTIILTTHDMDDIEEVCKRIVLIDKGNIIHDDNMDSFRNTYGTDRLLKIQLAEPVNDFRIDTGRVESIKDSQVTIVFKKDQISATQLIHDIITRYPVLDCQLQEPKIEHLIRDVYEKRRINQ